MELYIIVVISLVLSALFSGTEIAFVSSNKLYFELQKKQGTLAGRIIAKFNEEPSRFISAMLVGNTLTLVLYGVYMGKILDPMIAYHLEKVGWLNDANLLLIQTILSTLVVLITAEFLPKTFFRLNPDALLEALAVPINILYKPLSLLVDLILPLSSFLIVKGFGLKFSEDKPVYRIVDLSDFLRDSLNGIGYDEDKLPEIDTEIFSNAVVLKNTKIRDCLIPRTEITAVEINSNIEDLKKAFIESGHSKVLVYEETIDQIIGYCHVSDLFKNPQSISEEGFIKEIIIVPETYLAQELMVQFISERKSIALVVDEFGGTSGVVALEDIVEEIFGEIQDEYDQDEDWIERKIDEYSYELSARHEISYLNENYSLGIPEADYDTLGGYVLYINEDIPEKNDVIEDEPFKMKILNMDKDSPRIDTILLTLDKAYWDKKAEERNEEA